MVQIPLGGHRGGRRAIIGHTKVDDLDAGLGDMAWHKTVQGYAADNDGVLMHRRICGLAKGDGLYVDHVNHDKLDNRRANLRVVTNAENMQNRAPRLFGTSRHRGVSYCKRTQRWVAQVTICGTNHFLGRYHDEDEAGRVADEFRRSRNLVPG